MAKPRKKTEAIDQQEQYSEPPDYDSWYSAGASFAFHFCLVMLAPLFQAMMEPAETLPVEVGVVQVAEATSDASDVTEGLPGSEDALELSAETDMSDMPTDVSMENMEEVQQIDVTSPEVDVDSLIEEAQTMRQEATDAAAAARAAAKSATDKLNENLGGKPGGGTSTGGGGGTGRAGRAARWVLRFNTSSPQNYLAQMGGLGAEVAFPQRGDQYVYFSNLDSTPTKTVRDLAQENRIFWIDQNRGSFGGVAKTLGVPSAPMMLALMPTELEQRMTKLELAFKGAASEEQIIQTVFECVSRGGGYDVIVVDQKP